MDDDLVDSTGNFNISVVTDVVKSQDDIWLCKWLIHFAIQQN